MSTRKGVWTMSKKVKHRTPTFSKSKRKKTDPKVRKMKKTLNKIAERERERLGSSCVVNTRNFSGRQRFGAVSEGRRLDPSEYPPEYQGNRHG